jgi:hypothetical protein
MSDEAPPLPQILAEQASYLWSKLAPEAQVAPSELMRQVDAVLLNLCEYAEADMSLLDAIMGMRAATEGLARSIEDPVNTDPAEARAKVELEFIALVNTLGEARPSAMSRAMGLDW